jgi:hypothetical protein
MGEAKKLRREDAPPQGLDQTCHHLGKDWGHFNIIS